MELIKMSYPKKIIFLCKRNIVRSYFAEVIFSCIYPDFEFMSAGFIPVDQSLDFSWRSKILTSWGFDDPARQPRTFESIKGLLKDGDVLVSLDSAVPLLLDDYPSIIQKISLVNPTDKMPDWSYTFDPFGGDSNEITLAICRTLFTAQKLLWETLKLPKTNLVTIFWDSAENYVDEIDLYCQKELSLGHNIVFLQPLSLKSLSISAPMVRKFDIEKFEINFSTNPRIWVANYEHPHFESMLLSKSWIQNFNHYMCESYSKIVAGPLMYHNRYLHIPLMIGNLTKEFEVLGLSNKEVKFEVNK
jgi:protein-tyrosine-phosphatase